jgi:hypothetical protein
MISPWRHLMIFPYSTGSGSNKGFSWAILFTYCTWLAL